DRDVERLEDAGGEPLFLTQQPEQDVLGADVVVLQRPRFVLRENHDLASSFSKPFEHSRPLFRLTRRCKPIGLSEAPMVLRASGVPMPAEKALEIAPTRRSQRRAR